MTPQLFERAGRAMFGERWFRDMGDALGMREDTVKQLAKGRQRMPLGLARDLSMVMLKRANDLREVRAEVAKAAERFHP